MRDTKFPSARRSEIVPVKLAWTRVRGFVHVADGMTRLRKAWLSP